MDDALALLITTSGSTGSPKLVRQSYDNLLSNCASICDYLAIDANERPLVYLPMNYVYGLSVIHSHGAGRDAADDPQRPGAAGFLGVCEKPAGHIARGRSLYLRNAQ